MCGCSRQNALTQAFSPHSVALFSGVKPVNRQTLGRGGLWQPVKLAASILPQRVRKVVVHVVSPAAHEPA